jgi:hypothetical protein
MRRALALLLTLPLLGLAATLVPPASAGETFYRVVRELDSRFDAAGYTCTGEPAAAPTIRIGLSEVHVRGQGSMLVRSGADTTAAPLLVDPAKPSKVSWYAWPTEGADPHGLWRVEMNDDVLTSDPLPLAPRSWNRLWLADATLHSGDWSGTIADYIAEFGKGEHWKVGLLTGDCLGSPEVRLDAIGTRTSTFDFEARTWLTLKVADPSGNRWTLLDYGDPFQVVVGAHRWDAAADRARSVADARVTFLRRWAGTHRWTPVAHLHTADNGRVALEGVAKRAAYWRAVWHRSPEPVPSPDSYQGSTVVFSLPVVDGRRCQVAEDAPLTCARVTVSRGRVVLSGHARPGGSAIVHLRTYPDETMGEPLVHKQTRLDHNGRWRIAFSTGSRDELFAVVDADATSRRNWTNFSARIPLRVR